MFKLLNLKKDENGNGILICIIVLFIMIGIGGLVVDASILYKAKGEMRKAANAAVLSGAQVILQGDDSITNVVNTTLNKNQESDCDSKLQIKPGGENKLTLTLKKDVPLYFMKVFGKNYVPIEVASSAKVGPLGGVSGVIPLYLPDNTQYKVGDSYTLNNGPGEGNKGNFGYLNFNQVYRLDSGTKISVTDPKATNGNGANTLNYFITNGFGPEIRIGYYVSTEPGINDQKVATSISTRINQTVVILLYDHTVNTKGGSVDVPITGFACFLITGYDDSTKLITGKFVDYVTTGYVDDSKKNNVGAYGISLVE